MNKKSCRALVAALLCAAAPVLADDLEKGKEINGTCAACHGEFGQGGKKGEYPRIGGQRAGYIEDQLRSFRSRTRINIPMFPYTQERELPDEDIKAVAAYLACIHYCDANVGRVLDALNSSPHRDNTIVVLLGDHGWHLGEKDHWQKFTLWERSCRAPLIIRTPSMAHAGADCSRIVELLDLYPTLIDLCGLPAKPGLEGVSLKPLLANPSVTWDRPAITSNGAGRITVRTEVWRYSRYADGEELYDELRDPNEWHNLATKPEHTAIKSSLAKHLPRSINRRKLRQWSDLPTAERQKLHRRGTLK